MLLQRSVVPPGGSRAVQDHPEANLLVLIIVEVRLNIINCITIILSVNSLILMGGSTELAEVKSGRGNPPTRTRGNSGLDAGEQPAVEGGTRLLLLLGLNIRGNLVKNKSVRHKELGSVVRDLVKCSGRGG